jgi:hypothetical protein
MAPPHTFFGPVLDADTAELIELEAEVEPFDNELATEDVAGLGEADAFKTPFESLLCPDEIEELAASDKLDADSGSFPTIEDEAFSDKLLPLSTLPCGVPRTELDTWSMMLLSEALATDAALSTVPCEVPMIELRLLAIELPTEITLSALP